MGNKLAIKGHPARGNEVIELLEMLGGSNIHNLSGNDNYSYYFIKGIKNEIRGELHVFSNENIYYFTLEKFLGKYPFKIGDKVIDKADGCPGVVSEMKWDEDVSDMKYFVAFGNGIDFGWYVNDSIEFCKETDTVKPITNKNERTHEDVIFDSIIWHLRNSVNNGKQNLSGGECEDYFRELVKKVKEQENKDDNNMETCKYTDKIVKKLAWVSINDWDCADEVELNLDEYEIVVRDGKTYAVRKKSKYPTTYEECCDKTDFKGGFKEMLLSDDEYSLYISFIKLKRCRNAYWKIAGKELGLGKPWEPQFENCSIPHYCIFINHRGEVCNDCFYGSRCLLAFPTEEMRDAFFKNFKKEIEQCKELL